MISEEVPARQPAIMSIRMLREGYTPEMALLILICRAYFNQGMTGDINDFLAQNKIDTGLFEQMIKSHQLRPFVYKVMAISGGSIADLFLPQLRNKCFKIATCNLRNVEELVRLHQMLKSNGIANVAYKGVILSKVLFDDYISRETSDIDYLLAKEDFAKAHELLINEGYKPRYYNPDFEQQFLNTSHELLYRKNIQAGSIKIELHWAITSNMLQIPLQNEDLYAHMETIKLPGGAADTFNLQNHLLSILVHHGVNDIWRSLKHIIDIAVFVEKYRAEIDWVSLYATTRKYKIRHTAEIGFNMAHRLFGIEVPPPFARKMAIPDWVIDNLLRFPSIGKGKLNFDSLRQQLFLRDTRADKIRLLWSYLHAGITPNIRDMEYYQAPKGGYALYYFIKPFRRVYGKY